jgi:uncharacterized membrane protein
MSGKRYKNRQMVPARQPELTSDKPSQTAAIQARFQGEFFSGPLPPPNLLARYNDVVANGAERILAMAERQSKHRELLEAQVVAGNLKSQDRGTLYAFIIALITILGGIFLIYMGKDASGLATIISSLVGLISIFVYSKYKQGKERVEKSTTLAERRRQ